MADELEIEETEESPEQESSGTQKYEIMNYPADTTLSGYVDLWDRKQLIVPEFQRGYVWDQVKASKLIESFLLGLPVPGVFLFKERASPSFIIVDGQQRITSVVYYLKGVFGENRFRLKGVDKKWEGNTFEELSEQDRFTLNACVLRSTIIQQLSPDDRSSIYLIFERLNTGGVNLNPMEIRQCVSFGAFVKCLKDMNTDKNWRRILGAAAPDKRLRDVELALRCISLAHAYTEYEKPMKRFLNDFMERERDREADFAGISGAFRSICAHIVAELGDKPFHLRGRLNYGVLDSVFFALSRNGAVSGLRSKLDLLLTEQRYAAAVTYNTSDAAELNTRLMLAEQYLK